MTLKPERAYCAANISAELDLPPSGEPTAIARSVERLKKATFGAVAKREKLPQPLFWSLFCVEVAELRKRKERQRVLRQLFLE